LVHEWSVVNQIVTFFEFSRNEDVTELLSNWVPGFVLDAWFKSINGWSLLTSFSLPFLDEFDDIVFDISFWGKEIIGSVIIEVTTETSKSVFVVGGGSEVNGLFSVEHNSATHARNHQSFSIDSFDGELSDMDWKRSNWLIFNVDSATGDKFNFGFEVSED
jgi:hypothetical protein